MLNIDENFMYWIAGLFEGEANFSKPLPSSPHYARILTSSIDEDIISKVAQKFGVSYHKAKRVEHWKQIYRVGLGGSNAITIMKMIYPVMSQRRQAKIDEILLINPKWQEITPSFLLEPPSSGSIYELYWLAGLLEGEGSFMKGAPSEPNSPRIQMFSTDEDVIARVATIFDRSYATYERGGIAKTAYVILLRGTEAIEWMNKLKPLMGQRRQEQIDTAITSYDPDLSRNTQIARSPFTMDQVKVIKHHLKNGDSVGQIAKEYGVKYRTVWRIAKGERWAWLEE